ncbi:hypothetical protein [Candidatus Anaplasma sp. TIGMIC]|uniref:hypothetical protein n=1 Tax=Candidatus Anaplasma sp. TIGMIC TaxID=3020713 RepID=UPI00232EC63B|nr:hypothetical protein [Candidatus Anaplasma sp. TIGMIC]MDB1135576.1 hypothetical protein [Candidatus Anaplasma sp. TIGMIC]
MAYDVINSNTERLGETLSVQRAEDIESFAHILHAAHPVVDSLLCKNGTRIVAESSHGVYMNGLEKSVGTELGRDCSGTPRRGTSGLGLENRPGISFAVSSGGSGKWPMVSKSVEWDEDNGGDLYTNWGRTENERLQWIFPRIKYVASTHSRYETKGNKQIERSWWRKYMLIGRAAWLMKNPTWWDEKRREAEVDASSQVAGEMTDMNLDNKAIVAGHKKATVRSGD